MTTRIANRPPVAPRPNDPLCLFAVALAAHRSGDKTLAALTRDWLAELGVRVTFDRKTGGTPAPDSTRPLD
jgi:hypothetical protein